MGTRPLMLRIAAMFDEVARDVELSEQDALPPPREDDTRLEEPPVAAQPIHRSPEHIAFPPPREDDARLEELPVVAQPIHRSPERIAFPPPEDDAPLDELPVVAQPIPRSPERSAFPRRPLPLARYRAARR
jgi:hypothetical protein